MWTEEWKSYCRILLKLYCFLIVFFCRHVFKNNNVVIKPKKNRPLLLNFPHYKTSVCYIHVLISLSCSLTRYSRFDLVGFYSTATQLKLYGDMTGEKWLDPHLMYIEINIWGMDPETEHLLENQRCRDSRFSRLLRSCKRWAVVQIIVPFWHAPEPHGAEM